MASSRDTHSLIPSSKGILERRKQPKKNTQDHIYKSMTDGIRDTLAEFGLLEAFDQDSECEQKDRKD